MALSNLFEILTGSNFNYRYESFSEWIKESNREKPIDFARLTAAKGQGSSPVPLSIYVKRQSVTAFPYELQTQKKDFLAIVMVFRSITRLIA